MIGASNAEEGLGIGRAIKRTRGGGRTGTWQAGPAGGAGGTGGEGGSTTRAGLGGGVV